MKILIFLSLLLCSSTSMAGGIDPSVGKFLEKTIGEAAIERERAKKPPPPPPPPPPVVLVGIDLKLGTTTLTVGSTTTARVVGTFSDGSKKDVTNDANFSSTRPEVAFVVGVVITAISAGTTTIRAEVGTYTSQIQILVIPPPPPPPPPPANRPPVVENLWPYNGQSSGIQAGTVTIQWSATDPDGDHITYNLFLGVVGFPIELIGVNLLQQQYAVFVAPATTYQWYVIATDEHGSSTTGATWQFTTAVPPPPITYGWVQFSSIPIGCLFQLNKKFDLVGSGTTGAGTTTIQVVVGDEYDLMLITPWGDTMAKSFKIEEKGEIVEIQFVFPPKIIVVAPATATARMATLTITGYNFWLGIGAMLTQNSQEILGLVTTHQENGTITTVFDLSTVGTGTYSLVVKNPDGQQGTLTSGFEVVDEATPPPPPPSPAPEVLFVVPGSSTNAGMATVTITGNDFQEGCSAYLYRPGQYIPVEKIISVTSTTLVATFNLTNQAPGKRSVIVENPDGQRGTLTDGFEVVAPPVAYGWIQLSSIPIDCFFQLDKEDTRPATSGVTTAGTTTIKVEVGRYYLMVTTPWGDIMATSTTIGKGQVFSFKPVFPPRIIAVAPATATSGMATTLTITGYNFWLGIGAMLTQNSQEILGLVTTHQENGTITVVFDLSTAGTGTYSLVVKNPDGQQGTLTSGFKVVDEATPPSPPPAPIVSFVTPGSSTNAGMATVTIFGNHFMEGTRTQVFFLKEETQLSLSGKIVSVTSTTLVATFDLTNQTPGKRSVVVENPDSQRGTLTNGFEVVAPPPQKGWLKFSTVPPGCFWWLDEDTRLFAFGQTEIGTTSVQVKKGPTYNLLVQSPEGDYDMKEFILEGEQIVFQFVFPSKTKGQ